MKNLVSLLVSFFVIMFGSCDSSEKELSFIGGIQKNESLNIKSSSYDLCRIEICESHQTIIWSTLPGSHEERIDFNLRDKIIYATSNLACILSPENKLLIINRGHASNALLQERILQNDYENIEGTKALKLMLDIAFLNDEQGLFRTDCSEFGNSITPIIDHRIVKSKDFETTTNTYFKYERGIMSCFQEVQRESFNDNRSKITAYKKISKFDKENEDSPQKKQIINISNSVDGCVKAALLVIAASPDYGFTNYAVA